ncbi:MAG: efflux RND transporter permease subunit [Spartobacteria bacterium]|nr:efflux RND transporter permease subunit [Spartobacteria bacterium]
MKMTGLKRGPIAWMVRNSVASNLTMLVLLLGGLIAAMHIKQEVFPDFDLDIVSVSVVYPGASPEEVEQGIILAVEEEVRGLNGVEKVTATAREGVGSIQIEMLLNADVQKVYQDIQQAVDRITTFPEESEQPQVTLLTRDMEIITLVLSGTMGDVTLRNLAEEVRDRLLESKDIVRVELGNIKPLEISVEISETALRKYNLTLNDIAGRLRAAALDIPAGGVKTDSGEILVRVKDRRDLGSEFMQIPVVTGADGVQVLLSDLAIVNDGFEDADTVSTYNGETAIHLTIYRVGNQTPIQVAGAARSIMKDLQQELPPSVHINVLYDLSTIFKQRMSLLLRNGAFGLILVVALLGLFLEMRLAFWVMMGIPISFLGAILFMPMMDLSINMVSMFAFIIALGIVVDDAIVVAEEVYYKFQHGTDPITAGISGAKAVAMPVTFSVLTNCITFLPMLLVPGVMGKIFRIIPIIVISVFLLSLLESLFILPSHLAHSMGGKRRGLGLFLHNKQQTFSHWFVKQIRLKYGPVLAVTLHFRYVTVACALAVLILTIGFVSGKRIGVISMPKVESDYAIAYAILPYGAPLKDIISVRDRLVQAAESVAAEQGGDTLVEGISAGNGGSYGTASGSHVIEIWASLTDPEIRPISTRAFVDAWRKAAGDIPGLESLSFLSDHGGPGAGKGITVELSHRNTKQLEKAGEALASMLEEYTIVSDIDDGVSLGKPQYDVKILPEGRYLGLTSAEIAQQIRAAFYGVEVLRQQRGRNEIKVKVRWPESERISAYDVEEMLVRTPAGTFVPLAEVARVSLGRAYNTIERRDGRRIIEVTANVTPDSETDRVLADLRGTMLPELQTQFPGLSFSFEGKQADFRDSMKVLGIGFVLAMLGVYAALAIPFKSYIQPVIVMFSIPFGLVGAVIGHVIMGYSISIISMMGLVALSGVVVNDSLVLIDYANQMMRSGMNVRRAVMEAGIRRFRPIMLTTITTFGGLMPMIFETSMQARFLIPMAISLGYGILFATIITLIIVPSLYLIIHDIVAISERIRSVWNAH